jgi:hypothetical protein
MKVMNEYSESQGRFKMDMLVQITQFPEALSALVSNASIRRF